MSSSTQNPETADTISTDHGFHARRVSAWILVFLFILFNIVLLVKEIDWNNRTIGWMLFRLDPRYWSLALSPILWGIVALMATHALKRFNRVRSKLKWLYCGIFGVVLVSVLWVSGWTALTVRRRIYQQLYIAYIMGPISLYIADGTWSWKLLIAPTMAVIAIGSLLSIAYKQRKKKNESEQYNTTDLGTES